MSGLDEEKAEGLLLDRDQREALASLLGFACFTAADGIYLLDGRIKRREVNRRAEAAFEEAMHMIAGEARRDWPALRRRLSELRTALRLLADSNISLHTLGIRRDYATTQQRKNAARLPRAKRIARKSPRREA